MSRTLVARSERRAFSRDVARRSANPKPIAHEVWVNGQPPPKLHLADPNRKARRKQGERHCDVSLLVHGPHDRAWLYSGTVNGGGQARINAKRNQRAEFWRTVRIRVSAEVEHYFRDSLHLLGVGARIDGRPPLVNWFGVDLDVHIPGAPADAVEAEPVYRSEYNDNGTHTAVLDHIVWLRADGSTIHDPVSV